MVSEPTTTKQVSFKAMIRRVGTSHVVTIPAKLFQQKKLTPREIGNLTIEVLDD